MDELVKQIGEIKEDIGELKGTVKMILEKLDRMERKYNGYTERTVEVEKELTNTVKSLKNHLKEHEREKGWKAQTRAAIAGGAAGSIVSFILYLGYRLLS